MAREGFRSGICESRALRSGREGEKNRDGMRREHFLRLLDSTLSGEREEEQRIGSNIL
jgi:hypothetical protein